MINANLTYAIVAASNAIMNITDRIIVGTIIYSKIESKSSLSYYDDANKMIKTTLQQVEELKATYLSYYNIEKYLNPKGYTSFANLSIKDYQYITNELKNESKIKRFSEKGFNLDMYKIQSRDQETFDFVKDIHEKIMVPIYKYYKEKNKITLSDFIIVSSTISNIIDGANIIFYIKEINASIIEKDILSKNITFELDYELGEFIQVVEEGIKIITPR